MRLVLPGKIQDTQIWISDKQWNFWHKCVPRIVCNLLILKLFGFGLKFKCHVGHNYTRRRISYLKFTFNGASSILSGNLSRRPSISLKTTCLLPFMKSGCPSIVHSVQITGPAGARGCQRSKRNKQWNLINRMKWLAVASLRILWLQMTKTQLKLVYTQDGL